jgi:hypothetical protein
MSIEHEEEPKPEEKKLRAILAAQPPTSTESVDAKKREMEAAKQREDLIGELRPLLEEWKRIEKQNAELQASKVAADLFLNRSIQARTTAISARLRQIDEALKGLKEDSGAGQPPETPAPPQPGKGGTVDKSQKK